MSPAVMGCLWKLAAVIQIASIGLIKENVEAEIMLSMFAIISAQLFVEKLMDVHIQVTSMPAEVQILKQIVRMKDVIMIPLLHPANGCWTRVAHATHPPPLLIVGIFRIVSHAILHLIASGMNNMKVGIVMPPMLLNQNVS